MMDVRDTLVVTSPVIGYRSWEVDERGRLTPRHRGFRLWRPGTNKARCRQVADHEPPVSGCDCGLYAYHDAGLTGTDYANPDILVGAVVGWGAMEVYHDGWRAEYARVVALARAMNERWVRRVARLYDVPTVRIGPAGEAAPGWLLNWSPLVREAEKHGEALHKSLLPEKVVDSEFLRAISQLRGTNQTVAHIKLTRQVPRGEVRIRRQERSFCKGDSMDLVSEVLVHPDDYQEMNLADMKVIYGMRIELGVDEEGYY